MKKKRAKKNCAECSKVPNGRMPRNGKNGNWVDEAGNKIAQPEDGKGFFKFSEPKTLPNSKVVDGIAYKDGFPNFNDYVVGGKHDLPVVTGNAQTDGEALSRMLNRPPPAKADYVLNHFEDGSVGYVPRVVHDTAEGGAAHVGGASMIDSELF